MHTYEQIINSTLIYQHSNSTPIVYYWYFAICLCTRLLFFRSSYTICDEVFDMFLESCRDSTSFRTPQLLALPLWAELGFDIGFLFYLLSLSSCRMRTYWIIFLLNYSVFSWIFCIEPDTYSFSFAISLELDLFLIL